MIDLLKAAALGVVEGLTEFLPISSTGHLIVAGKLLRFTPASASTFEVFIQLGAILSVLILYRQRFFSLLDLKRTQGFSGFRGLALLGATTLPALVSGAAVHGFIKEHLFTPATVAIGFAVGGVALILIEKFLSGRTSAKTAVDQIGWREAVLIGFFQCLALWPGMSRSASTILGGMILGLDRKTAAEYSFFAAVPVLFAAAFFDLFKNRALLQASDGPLFAVGFLVSFAAAWIAIRFFIGLVSKHDLKAFGWYRLAVAPIIYFFID